MDEDNTSIYEQIKEQVIIVEVDLKRLRLNTDYLVMLMESVKEHDDELKELIKNIKNTIILCQQALNKEE
jgi:hypothetical protein